MGDGSGTVADAVFDVGAEFGEGLGVAVGDEERVVAKTAGATLLGDDAASDDAVEVVLFAAQKQSDAGAEGGGPRGGADRICGDGRCSGRMSGEGTETVEEGVHVGFVLGGGGGAAVDGGVAGRIDARFAAQGIDLQT